MFEAAELGSSLSKEEYERLLPELRVNLVNAQYDLRNADFPVIVQIAGDDLFGCNEVSNVLNEWMDTRFIRTYGFRTPSEEEKERPRFWRYWRLLPRDGRTSIFNSAWTFQAIVRCVAGRLGDAGLDKRIDHIEQFERALVDDGALVIKLWLHLPKAELRKRLSRAKKDRNWAWRVDERDARIYKDYDKSMKVAQRVLRRTSTAAAPWEIIESTDPHYRDLTIGNLLLANLLRRLKLERPGESAVTAALAGIERTRGPNILDSVDLTKSLAYDEYTEKLAKFQARLGALVRKANTRRVTTVAVFEGWDAAGKGGIIRRMTRAMDARDYQVVPISAPTEEEKAHHYLWRFWTQLPRAGSALVFDRSWYGRVLVERVEGYATEPEWRRAYSEINDFEEQLVEHDIVLLKFWLHIDADEQRQRFKARESTPYKKYKITDDDYRNANRREEYEIAVDDMVARTSTEIAQWSLIPANDKRYARVEVLKTVCAALEKALD